MIFTHEITLDFSLNEIKTINIKQYTKDSFLLHVTLTDNGNPFRADKDSLKCYFKMETPDNKRIFTNGIINENGSVDIPIPEKSCLTAGSATAEIVFVTSEITSKTDSIAEDGNVLSSDPDTESVADYGTHAQNGTVFATMNLNVNIVESSYSNSHIISSDDFDALHSALLTANKTYDHVMASASASANAAKSCEDNAAASERNAAASADNAASSALLAKSYAVGDTGLNDRENEAEDCAKNYCEKAKQSKEASAALALLAKSYAVGYTGLNDRENENEDCAKTYCENACEARDAAAASASLAQSYAESFSGALRPMGTITFAELPPIANASEGDMYNISDQFTTDDRFREGVGLTIPLGTNVYKTADNTWDILAGSPVTGIKGNAELSYRNGNVNITPANIGLGNVNNTADKDKSVKYAAKAEYDTAGNRITDSYVAKNDLVNLIYPIGSIYMSVNSTNPATLFGGTWTAWGTGRVPVGIDTSQTNFNTVEKTGGSMKSSYTPIGSVGSHTLTTDEIPSHKHSVSVSGGSCTIPSSGSHAHQVKGSSTGASGTSRAIINGQGDKHYAAVESSGTHTHTVPNHTHTATETNIGGSKGHTHTFTGTAAEISAIQPYITCYMWKRTA